MPVERPRGRRSRGRKKPLSEAARLRKELQGGLRRAERELSNCKIDLEFLPREIASLKAQIASSSMPQYEYGLIDLVKHYEARLKSTPSVIRKLEAKISGLSERLGTAVQGQERGQGQRQSRTTLSCCCKTQTRGA